MSEDWGWAAVIIAIPFAIFGAFELLGVVKRRRYEAVARRPKDVQQSSSGERRSRAG